jgi:hypothetical protein
LIEPVARVADTIALSSYDWAMRRRNFIKAIGGAVALPVTARAQQPEATKIERIEVARPGLYEIQARNSMQDQSISTGHKVAVRGYKNLRTGTQIEAKIGAVIGAELTIVGAPRNAKVPIKVVWRYPAPGLVNPETKAAQASDEYSDVHQIGEKFPVFWGLSQDWHLVAGTWTLEVWQGVRKLVEQQFQLVKP